MLNNTTTYIITETCKIISMQFEVNIEKKKIKAFLTFQIAFVLQFGTLKLT